MKVPAPPRTEYQDLMRQFMNRERTAQLCRAVTRTLALATLLVGVTVTGASEPPERVAGAPLAQGTDLNEFMKQVLEKRDENWKKLQQYILDEREKIEVRGPAGLPIWGHRREYQWFIRDGYFVRSPLKADGVAVPEDDRLKYEERFLKRAKARDKKPEAGDTKPESGGGEIAIGTGGVEVLLQQTSQPGFIDSAYFMRFKFDNGRYALVGKEKFGEADVLRIEYYPAKLFTDEPGRDRERRTQEKRKQGDQDLEKTMDHLMNKNSKVTLWVEPKAKQIVRYVFDNVQMDFLPASWLVHMEELKASMTMSQPFKDVWLPKDVEMYFSAMLAIGLIDVRFNLDYHDYREATTSARIKGRGGF